MTNSVRTDREHSLFPAPTAGDFPSAGHVSVFGYHATYCNHDETLRQPGVSVTEHGRWCEGHVAGVQVNVDDYDDQLWVSNVRPYMHGVYPQGIHCRTELVGLFPGSRDGEEPPWATLTPPAARSLAAALIRAADSAEFH